MTGGWRPSRARQRATVAVAAVALSLTSSCTTGTRTSDRTAASVPSTVPTGRASAATDKPTVRPSKGPSASSSAAQSSPAEPTSPVPPATAERVPTGKPVTIAFGGDVHFEGASRAALDGFGPIADVLGSADLAMVNLETAVTDGGTPQPKEFNFRAPASAFVALRKAGVDVATMANNHGMDYGVAGLRDSLVAAAAAKFRVVGIGTDDATAFAPYRVTVHGQRIAILGATQVLDDAFVSAWSAGPGKPGLASAKQETRLLAAVRAARLNADTVVVYLHWGREGAACPTEPQRTLAPRLIAAGADIVVGSHAHVLLGGGWTDSGAFVDYGLGNFVFYANGGVAAQTGVLVLTVRGRAVTNATWKPAVIEGGRPYPVDGGAAASAVASWERLRGCANLQAHQSSAS